ncbi:MAG: flavoprotein [Egibacteraceae bacterium]
MNGQRFPAERLLLCAAGGIGAALLPAWILWLREHFEIDVRVALTRSAQGLVSAKALTAVSGRPVLLDGDEARNDATVRHIEAAEWSDAILVAPATANLLAKLAHGFADDLVTTVLLATERPVVLVPSLPPSMEGKPCTRRNLALLHHDGFGVAPTVVGRVAADGSHANGAMLDAPAAFAHLKRFIEGRASSARVA